MLEKRHWVFWDDWKFCILEQQIRININRTIYVLIKTDKNGDRA
jgi:hypothetical protein